MLVVLSLIGHVQATLHARFYQKRPILYEVTRLPLSPCGSDAEVLQFSCVTCPHCLSLQDASRRHKTTRDGKNQVLLLLQEVGRAGVESSLAPWQSEDTRRYTASSQQKFTHFLALSCFDFDWRVFPVVGNKRDAIMHDTVCDGCGRRESTCNSVPPIERTNNNLSVLVAKKCAICLPSGWPIAAVRQQTQSIGGTSRKLEECSRKLECSI